MFGLPAAKRVRRADLYSTSPSPTAASPDPELHALLHSQLSHVYGPPPPLPRLSDANTNITEQGNPTAHEDEAGYAFRLFAGPRGDQAPAQKDAVPLTRIILDEDDGRDGGDGAGGRGAFVVPRRDMAYYLTDAASPARRREVRDRMRDVAVEGDDVRRCLEVPYRGWQVKWRVRHLRERNGVLLAVDEGSATRSGLPAPLAAGLGPNLGGAVTLGSDQRKRKAGKKRRIILRARKRRVDEAAERALKQGREREEADREKRTRRNREKKVKKKLREKEKKANGKSAGLDHEQGDSNSDAG